MPKIGVGEVRISARAKANVLDVLDHDRLSYGPYSKQFEQRFAEIHRRRFACFVNSGTDALRIGLAALKEHYHWNDGDTVLVPALTFVASLNVITQNRLRPVLVDIDDYYGMDAEHVAAILGRHEAAEYPQPVAIMPVHLFGQPASPALHVLSNAFGIRVIADSCETMFVDGCAEGDVSCFSTFACHVIQTGVGGLATTNNPHLAALIRSYANHGRSGIYAGIDDALGQFEVIDARFKFEREGYSSRATELEAAIGCAELDDWQENIRRRNQNAEFLSQGLERLPLRLPRLRSESAWMMFPLEAADRETRDRLVQHLEANGIETRYMLPLTNQPYVKKLFGDDVESRFPNAKRVNECGFYIGCHPHMTTDDLQRVVQTFHDFFR